MNFLLIFFLAFIYFGISMRDVVCFSSKGLAGRICVPVADLVSPDVRFTLDEEPVVQAAIVHSGDLCGQRPTYRRTQLLYQEPVIILEEKSGWYRVRALEQEVIDADGSRGCHGWVQTLNVSTDIALPSANLVVTRRYVCAYSEPLLTSPKLLQFFCGTKLAGVEHDAQWYKINLFGGQICFIAKTDLDSIQDLKQLSFDLKRKRLVQCVEQFINAPYLWGGRSGLGVDCSSLMQLAYLVHGITIPRYAHGQWKKAQPLELKELQAGDLIFLGIMRDDQLVMVHVMLYAGNGMLLEAHGFLGKVRQISALERFGKQLHEFNNGDALPLRRFIFGGSVLARRG